MASIRFGRGPSGLGASSFRRPCVNALAHCGTPSTVRLRASRTSLVRELGLASAMLVSFLCSKQVSKVVERLRLRVRPALFNVNRRADAFNGKPRQVLQRFCPTSRDGLVVNPPCRRDPCGLKRRKGRCLVLMYYRGHCATIPVDPCTDQWDRELPGANGLNRKTTGTSEPYRVDKDQHLERIDAKFRDEFNRSRSVAADVTSQRRAYCPEAGYVLGHGYRWCGAVHEDEAALLHIGTRQFITSCGGSRRTCGGVCERVSSAIDCGPRA